MTESVAEQCECDVCKRHRHIEKVRERLCAEDAEFLDSIEVDLMHAEEDAVYWRLKYRGEWNGEPTLSENHMAHLKSLLAPRCCHVSGTHDPTHYEKRKYVCILQKAQAYDRFRKAIGLGEVTPCECVPEDGCSWCGAEEPGNGNQY